MQLPGIVHLLRSTRRLTVLVVHYCRYSSSATSTRSSSRTRGRSPTPAVNQRWELSCVAPTYPPMSFGNWPSSGRSETGSPSSPSPRPWYFSLPGAHGYWTRPHWPTHPPPRDKRAKCGRPRIGQFPWIKISGDHDFLRLRHRQAGRAGIGALGDLERTAPRRPVGATIHHGKSIWNAFTATLAWSPSSALKMSCIALVAAGCADFGSAARTFAILWNQHRCSLVCGNTSRSAAQNPNAPWPVANTEARIPRRRQPRSRSTQDSVDSRSPSINARAPSGHRRAPDHHQQAAFIESWASRAS